MKAQDPPSKPDNGPIWKRDLTDSSLRPFGRCIVSFDWSAFLNIHDCDIKYEKFNDTMSAMIDKFFPLERTRAGKDKTQNRNAEPEYGTGMRNRNAELKINRGDKTQNWGFEFIT